MCAWSTEFLDSTFPFVLSELHLLDKGKKNGAEESDPVHPHGDKPFFIDVVDQGPTIMVIAELPGIDRSQIDIHLQDSEVQILVKPTERANESGSLNYLLRERPLLFGARKIKLPPEVLVKAGNAKLEAGILTVTFTKETIVKGQRIPIG
jgi:HSP20 family molecular chaperone IbpA